MNLVDLFLTGVSLEDIYTGIFRDFFCCCCFVFCLDWCYLGIDLAGTGNGEATAKYVTN